ncbi:hypothetical protein ACLOJK_037962 [Asimina triloba]
MNRLISINAEVDRPLTSGAEILRQLAERHDTEVTNLRAVEAQIAKIDTEMAC